MNAITINTLIKNLIGSQIGVYKSINKPSIWMGIPPQGLIADGLEVIIPRFPEMTRANNTRIVKESWDINLNQFQPSNGVETIIIAIEKLKLGLKPMPRIAFIERPQALELKNFPVLTSACLTWEITEMYQIGNL
jgi:hypothetical protein